MKRVLLLLSFCFLLLGPLQADYEYNLSWENPSEHTYEVSLRTPPAAGSFSDFELPAWRPGRYYVQDYAAAVSAFQALDEKGQALSVHKVSPTTWRVQNPSAGNVEVRYKCYAHFMDAGSSYLDPSQAYFNPVNLFVHLAGQYDVPCTLRVSSMERNWKAATALQRDPGRYNVFTAASYHDFVDSPTVISPTLKTLQSRIKGVDFYFHFQGKFPDEKAVEDAFQSNLDKIIREQWGLFGEMPLQRYDFIYQLLPYNMGHAVEHKYSAMFALPDRITSSPEAIARANGISAHEFFHLWNVKRIRPAALWPYDYQREQYTTLHWFTEGVTEYYTQLTLVRAGLISREQFYRVLAGNIRSLDGNFASTAISPAQSSMDSWLARSDYGPSYHGISYYTQGMRLGLLLDLRIRSLSKGKSSLDDVLRTLYSDYFQQGKGYGDADLQAVIEKAAGESFAGFFADFVFGTRQPDSGAILAEMGLELVREEMPDATWEKLGITRLREQEDKTLVLREVLPASDAARGGLEAGMSIEMVNGKPTVDFDAEAFFYSHKEGKKLDLQCQLHGQVEVYEVTWTNTMKPEDISISENRRMAKKTRKLLDAWLESQALTD